MAKKEKISIPEFKIVEEDGKAIKVYPYQEPTNSERRKNLDIKSEDGTVMTRTELKNKPEDGFQKIKRKGHHKNAD